MLDALGEAALRTLLLAGVVQCGLWFLRIRDARLLLAAWTVVLAASIAMPVLQQVTPLRVPLDPAFPKPVIDGASELLQGSLLQGSPQDARGGGQGQLSPASWPLAAYLVVCAGMLLRVALGVALSVRLLFRAIPARTGGTQGVRVRVSRDIAGPVTIANTILLPVGALDWPADTRRAALAHEKAHVARWDYALLVASQLNRCVFWFSPLPWWLHRRLVELTELASDDQAIAILGDRLRYAEILLEMGRRSGPVTQGPAMARPASLPHRIERILLDRVHPHPTSRLRRGLLVAGAASLSLPVAGVISQPRPRPFIGSLPEQPGFQEEAASRQPDVVEQGGADREAASAPTLPQAGTQAVAEAQPDPASTPFPPVPVAAALSQPASRALQQVGRRAVQTASRGAPIPSPSRATARPAPVIAGRAEDASTHGPVERAAPSPSRGADAAITANRPASDETRAPLSRQVAFEALVRTLPPEFQGVMGSSCTGTIAIGQGARSSPDKQPYVVAGQVIPARAHFHLKADGTPWVRFDAFGQRPLDLPLRFTRNGITWTGGHGVAYTVQASGADRLIGLAGFFQNDSAALSFSCMRSVLTLL